MYLVLFTAQWCGNCKRVKPALERIVKEGYRGINHLTVYSKEEDPVMFNVHRVSMIPMITLHDDLDREFFVSCGYITYEALKSKIDAIIKNEKAFVNDTQTGG